MKKIGLALSGGGFRATLYHLGLVRFLRDANLLRNVSHITSVSGGSIFAAHLALNWARYNGSESEFESAAAEIISFVRLDVRNRVTRRFPLFFFARWPSRMLGFATRKLTRTGLLEYHYEKHLYGDTSLFQLPQSPQLHILATNLSEGCLCSFNRDGLWMMRRKTGSVQIERIQVGLATVPMAVAASSAFPGFFPPLSLTGADVGALAGEFGRQAFTDGGVFDNLGVRMYRFLDPLLRGENAALDGVLVSDVGKPFEVQNALQSAGLIRTAMRASDILMDRVWQLENETFKDTAGFVFARSTSVVEPGDDATALHPEVQRQAAYIRTDLDRFSPLEISSLVKHGYCVGRKACRERPDLFGTDLPSNPPWNPMPETHMVTVTPSSQQAPRRDPTEVTVEARKLQRSAIRRIWSTLLDYRDWTSYVYVPILIPLILFFPYLVVRYSQHSYRVSRLIESISQGSPDYEIMAKLLDAPMPRYVGEPAEEVRTMEKPDLKGFEMLQDSRILDLRPWDPGTSGTTDPDSFVYGYRRIKVLKKHDNTDNHIFRIYTLATHAKAQFRFPAQEFRPKLRMMYLNDSPGGEKTCRFEVSIDTRKLPAGDLFDLSYEHYSPGTFLQRTDNSTTISTKSEVDTAEVTRWIMMPRDRLYKSFQMFRYENGKPDTVETVKGFTEYLSDDSSILAFKLVSVKAGYTYETSWYYK